VRDCHPDEGNRFHTTQHILEFGESSGNGDVNHHGGHVNPPVVQSETVNLFDETMVWVFDDEDDEWQPGYRDL
jgi:hypothetical protein